MIMTINIFVLNGELNGKIVAGKLPFASPTGQVDIFGFVIIFEKKKRTN